MRVTVRNEPREKGLASVLHFNRGYEIRVDNRTVGRVGYSRGLGHGSAGWFWYAMDEALNIPLRNSAFDGATYATKEKARDACLVYVRESLRLPAKKAKA